MYAIRDADGKFLASSRTGAGAHRRSRSGKHLGASVNRAFGSTKPEDGDYVLVYGGKAGRGFATSKPYFLEEMAIDEAKALSKPGSYGGEVRVGQLRGGRMIEVGRAVNGVFAYSDANRAGGTNRSHEEAEELFQRWMNARWIRDHSGGARRQKYYGLADELQYKLQDSGKYGNSLVWGTVGSKRQDDWIAARLQEGRRNRAGGTKRGLARRERGEAAVRELERLVRLDAYSDTPALRVGQKIDRGAITITAVGTHTVQYKTRGGYSGSIQIPFVGPNLESLPSHRRALAEYGMRPEDV